MGGDKNIRARFWVEAALAAMTGVLTVVTLIVPAWIEVVFGVDPDRGSGALEWALVGGLAVVTVISGAMAIAEWRRLAPI